MDYTYKCFKVKQRERSDIIFLAFVANAKDIYNWSHADSIDIDKNGVQRPLQKPKWSKITKFFDTHTDNIIPNNIILAFDDEVSKVDLLFDADKMIDNKEDGFLLTDELDGFVELTINSKIKKNTYIIDGQHRLKGMSEYESNLPIVVSLFINMKKLDRAFQFLTINNKASKVKTDNIKALIANFAHIEGDLKERLATASISAGKFSRDIDIVDSDRESPFYKCIDWSNNREGSKVISTLAIENSLKTIQKTFPELIENSNENKSIVLELFYNIWHPAIETYSITHENISIFLNLFKKATIQSITEYICTKLSDDIVFAVEEIDITEKEVSQKYMRGLLHNIPKNFWKNEWQLKGLDNQAGRTLIIKEISKLKRNINSGKDPYEDLELYKDDS